jgi:hypothetical protein
MSPVFAYTQFITALILGAETAFVQPQSGATKLQSVLTAIQAATQVGLMVAPNATTAQWTALVNAEVAILNATGVFGKPAVQ